MSTKYDAVVRLLMDNRDFLRGTDRSERAIKDTGKSAERTRRNFKDLAKSAALTFGAGGAIVGILRWADAGAELAIQAELVARTMDNLLGPASDRLVANNERLARSMGLTTGEFEKALLPLANVGDSLGLTADENERFLTQLFEGAADLAVYNGEISSTRDILENLQSATRGEYDALQKYIPAISAAAVEQRALADTGKDAADQLTQQEKLVATYNIVLDEMAKAYGSATEAIEDGTLAQQEANTELREAQTEVGEVAAQVKGVLFTALLRIKDLLTGIGKGIADVIRWFRELRDSGIPVISQLADLMQGLIYWLSGAKGGWQELVAAINRVKSAIRSLIATIKSIPSRIPNPFSATLRAAQRLRGLLGFQTGGVVPGPQGTAQLAVVHGGERVLTPQQQRQRGGGEGGGMAVTINISSGLNDPQTVAREVVDLLTLFNRTNGAIPIEVRSGGS